jgi:Trypsin-co-occurring domain 2
MFKKHDHDAVAVPGLGLAEAIGLLRDELLKAREAGAASDIQLPVDSLTVELGVTATRSVDGKAGFVVPVVGVHLGGGVSLDRASEQKVTVVFGPPVGRDGVEIKVASAADAEPQ